MRTKKIRYDIKLGPKVEIFISDNENYLDESPLALSRISQILMIARLLAEDPYRPDVLKITTPTGQEHLCWQYKGCVVTYVVQGRTVLLAQALFFDGPTGGGSTAVPIFVPYFVGDAISMIRLDGEMAEPTLPRAA